jgi:hypothetical protein
VIERWVRAYNKGIDWINANKGSEDWAKLVATHTRMAPDQVRNIALPVWDKTVNVASIEKMVEVMRMHGLLAGDRKLDVPALLHATMTTEVK